MQQLFELRVAGEFLQRAPILLAGFRLELFSYGGQIHRVFVGLRVSGRMVVIGLADDALVLFVVAHTVHHR